MAGRLRELCCCSRECRLRSPRARTSTHSQDSECSVQTLQPRSICPLTSEAPQGGSTQPHSKPLPSSLSGMHRGILCAAPAIETVTLRSSHTRHCGNDWTYSLAQKYST